jgi:hypothetical protein
VATRRAEALAFTTDLITRALGTAKTHISRLYEKMGAANRAPRR